MPFKSRAGEKFFKHIVYLYQKYGARLLVRFSSSERATFNPLPQYSSTPFGTYAYPAHFIFVFRNNDVLVREDYYGVREGKYAYFFALNENANWFVIDGKPPQVSLDHFNYLKSLNILKENLQKHNLEIDALNAKTSDALYGALWVLAVADIVLENANVFKRGLRAKLERFFADRERKDTDLQNFINACQSIANIDVTFYAARARFFEEFEHLILENIIERLNGTLVYYFQEKDSYARNVAALRLSLLLLMMVDRIASYGKLEEIITGVSESRLPFYLTTLFRKAGFDGIVDVGTGTIYKAEPAQVVWWSPKAASYVDRLDNIFYLMQDIDFIATNFDNNKNVLKERLRAFITNNQMDLFINLMDNTLYKKYIRALQYAGLIDPVAVERHALGFQEFINYLRRNAEKLRSIFMLSLKAPVELWQRRTAELFKPTEVLRNTDELSEEVLMQFNATLSRSLYFMKQLLWT